MASPGALPCLKTSALNSLAPVTTAPASSHHPSPSLSLPEQEERLAGSSSS